MDAKGGLHDWKLFDNLGVKRAVASWVLKSKSEQSQIPDPLHYLFGDLWSRCEYECVICPWPFKDGAKVAEIGEKYDVYTLYVVPNASLLLEMVENVSATSARKWRAEENRRLKR